MSSGCSSQYFTETVSAVVSGEKVTGAGMGNGLAGLAYFASNDSDPYITLKNPVRKLKCELLCVHTVLARIGVRFSTAPRVCNY